MRKSEKYYTVKEAGEFLGVTSTTILRWINEGHLKATKKLVKGRRWARMCYFISHSALLKEKKTVARCLWCKEVIEGAKQRRVRKYCCPEHTYLHKKSIGYYDKRKK